MCPSDTAPDFGPLREALQPFSFEGAADLSEPLREYCRFYQIDFERSLDVSHRMGAIRSNEYTLSLHCWMPEEPKGTVFVVHGYFDHVGIYRHPIGFFLRRGYAVVAYDQPGHGLSSGERAAIDSFASYVYALQDVIDFTFDACPPPWHIIGQSMGGAVTMTFLLDREFSREDCPFTEIVLLAPLVYPRGWAWARWLHLLLRGFIRARPRDFAINSHDRAFLEFIRHRDSLQPRRLPMEWVTALKNWIGEFGSLAASSLTPTIIQGTDDSSVDWQRNMRRIAEKFPLATIHYVSGARHHLVNESEEFSSRIFELLAEHF